MLIILFNEFHYL